MHLVLAAQPSDVCKIVPGHRCERKCFGKFWPKDVSAFLKWELSPTEVASRPPGKSKHQSAPIAGRHVGYFGKHKDMRRSDLVERVYCAFEVLRMSPCFVDRHADGKGGRTAVIEMLIGERLGARLGHSRRGRPRKGQAPKFESFEKTGTIYGLWHRFRERHPWPEHCPDPIVARHLDRYWRVRNYDAAMKRARRQGGLSEAAEQAIARKIMEGSDGRGRLTFSLGPQEGPPNIGRPRQVRAGGVRVFRAVRHSYSIRTVTRPWGSWGSFAR